MKKNLTLMLVLMTFIVFIFGSLSELSAQNETGTRYLNKTMFQKSGLWLDSSTYMFQHGFPIIKDIPPLSTGMPYEVMLGYIYLDSLLTYAPQKSVDSLLNTWDNLNDTLTGALKYHYILNDYNPIIFQQYAGEVKLHQKINTNLKIIGYEPSDSNYTPIRKYQSDLTITIYKAVEKFRKIYESDMVKALYSMLYADYILRIEVLDIDSMQNKNSSLDYNRYNVTARIKDTLQGQVIPEYDYGQYIVEEEEGEKYPLFTFQYTPLDHGHIYVLNENRMYTQADTAFMENGDFDMDIGQEAIVFLRFVNHKYDFEYDYYDLDLEPRCSLNLLRINENDNVIDVNNVWSENIEISYDNWKQIYQNLLSIIMNMNY